MCDYMQRRMHLITTCHSPCAWGWRNLGHGGPSVCCVAQPVNEIPDQASTPACSWWHLLLAIAQVDTYLGYELLAFHAAPLHSRVRGPAFIYLNHSEQGLRLGILPLFLSCRLCGWGVGPTPGNASTLVRLSEQNGISGKLNFLQLPHTRAQGAQLPHTCLVQERCTQQVVWSIRQQACNVLAWPACDYQCKLLRKSRWHTYIHQIECSVYVHILVVPG